MRRVILNADDLGYEPNVTRGIVEAMRAGIVSSCTYLVNGPFSAEAAPHVDELAVGLHFNLARWQALSDGHRLQEAAVPSLSSDWVARELEAQHRHCAALLGRTPTHVDVHKHLHRHRNVLEGVVQAALQLGLAIRSIDEAMRSRLQSAGVTTNDVFVGEADGPAYWTLPVLEATLRALPSHGVIELMCHPGYRPTAFSSGYAEQREVELATFVSPAARAMGVEFSTWKLSA